MWAISEIFNTKQYQYIYYFNFTKHLEQIKVRGECDYQTELLIYQNRAYEVFSLADLFFFLQ